MTQIIRVFPRRTRATPDDHLAFVGDPPLWLREQEIREVHVSCTFAWDRREAERLAEAWQFGFPDAKVLLGGPAFGSFAGQFEPGRYLRQGYVITSRGCPNRCAHCLVPDREGHLRTLPVREGWDVLDNNLLACPESHIAAVLAMLRRQPHRPRFTGGLEAARLTAPVACELLAVRPAVLFLAYDRPSQWRHVEAAAMLLRGLAGWSKGGLRHHVGCYVLGGYEGDTIDQANARVARVIDQGLRAYPMVWRGEGRERPGREWVEWRGGILSFGGRT